MCGSIDQIYDPATKGSCVPWFRRSIPLCGFTYALSRVVIVTQTRRSVKKVKTCQRAHTDPAARHLALSIATAIRLNRGSRPRIVLRFHVKIWSRALDGICTLVSSSARQGKQGCRNEKLQQRNLQLLTDDHDLRRGRRLAYHARPRRSLQTDHCRALYYGP